MIIAAFQYTRLIYRFNDVFVYQQQTSQVLKTQCQDFPHSPVVKNVPNNAGEMGSIPGLRRCLMVHSS